MSQKNKKTYKEDIRQTLILYALIPAMILTIAGFMALAFGFYRSIINHNKKINKEMAIQLNRTLSAYMSMANEFTSSPDITSNMEQNLVKVEDATILYKHIGSQSIRAEFYLINAENQVLAASTRRVPSYIMSKPVSNVRLVQRVRENEELANISVENLESSGKALIIGKAIKKEDQYLGMLIFELDQEIFARSFGEITSSNLILTDRHNYVFWGTDPLLVNRFGKILDEFQEDRGLISSLGTKFYSNNRDILNGKLKVYTISQIGEYNRIFITAGIILMFIFSVFYSFLQIGSSKVAHNKTKVIDQIVDTMSYTRTGKFDRPMTIHSEDEFQQIAISYNQMLSNIQSLMDDNQEIGRQNIMSQIKQLEAQFDPHFIFNTLELIKYMVKIEPAKASKVIVGMSNLLRDSLDTTSSYVTLKKDIEYTQDYLMIQKLRFDEKLDYDFIVDEQVLDCIIPKRSIQPIVENALVHGVDSQYKCKLMINIFAQGEELVIIIKDNGKGIEEDKLKEIEDILKQRRNTSKHNGLYNVHRRIQLIYGKEYGIEIEKMNTPGTMVTIRLPINKERDNYD